MGPTAQCILFYKGVAYFVPLGVEIMVILHAAFKFPSENRYYAVASVDISYDTDR